VREILEAIRGGPEAATVSRTPPDRVAKDVCRILFGACTRILGRQF